MSEYWVTGNEFVSLPTIRQGDGAIEGLSFLHMGAKGMIELRGGEGGPLIAPFVELDGRPVELEGLKWGRLHSWVPRFEAGCGGCRLEGTLLAPIGERGFGYHLRLSAGEAGAEYALGLRGCWAEALHSVNESKAIEAEKHAYRSAWNHSFVLDMRPGLSLFAFAPIFTEDPANCPVRDRFCTRGDEVRYSIELPGRLAAGESAELCVWFGLGFEEVSAATSAKEMLRQGYGAELRKTLDWLAQRERTVGDAALDETLNLNMFFSYFFAGGLTLDSEEFALVTSRSPRYYVSAAYWDRDSLLWSFPAILLADAGTAAEMLRYVFTRQIRNVGLHSRYIDGTLLEPGFELDELCAPVIALGGYVERTGDRDILREDCVRRGLERILRTLGTKRAPDTALYESFLQPTDDMCSHPYICYDNVLVWYALRKADELFPGAWPGLSEEAGRVREAIYKHCVKEKDGREIFAWSVDLKGGWDVYDEPPGSLLLLPHYGFCSTEDEIWRNTAAEIRREDYRYSFAGCPIAEIGCAHAPHPWVLSIANSLLSDRRESAREHLSRCAMDNGIACESVDEYTGESRTGEAFATCAGFLAYAIDSALGGRKRVAE